MTTIASMNPQTRDPILRLPYETWLQCLSLAIHDSADGPLSYLTVSPNWSENILRSPTLWTQIIINNGEDEEARLHTFLHLSAGQLLDVDCLGNVPLQLLQLLAQHRMRLRSLVISSAAEATIPVQLWSSLGNPKMRRLVFRDWGEIDPIAHALIPSCPDLRSLERDRFIEESMIVTTLEEARVFIRTLADLRYLYKCTPLSSLAVMRDVGLLSEPESMPEPKVRNHFIELSSHLGPHLVDLEIMVSLKEFIVFVPCIPSFVALYSATLVILMPEEELPSRIATPIPRPTPLNLRMLSLELAYSGEVDELATPCDAFRHILEYLGEHQILQDLHTFQCDFNAIHVHPVRIGPLLRCLSKVRVLHLIFEEIEEDIPSTHPPIHMPYLLELSLSPITWLAHIKAPNLVSLDFSLYIYSFEDNSVAWHLSEYFSSKVRHLVVDKTMSRAINKAYSIGVGPRFESLRKLQIVDSLTAEWVVHLSSIRIIDITYLTMSWSLNSLLLDLLRHPEALPNLSIIKTRSNPCWELLFEVLRRRNTAGMHRIQELVLPSVPLFAILYRLVKLLQGHTDVYTNRDIDEVIYKRQMDKRFTDTCGDCLSLGYIGCLLPLSLGIPAPNPEPSLGEMDLVDLLTLESTKSSDMQKEFRGWGDWETLMKESLHSAILSGEINRRWEMECIRSEKGAAAISEDTLFGIPLPSSLA